jgi:hypothetical protein
MDMLRILDQKLLHSSNTESRLKFETEGGGSWPIWDRFISLDGKHAYNIGNICQTCAFLFQRMHGANSSVEMNDTADLLKAGVSQLSDAVVEKIIDGLPEGDYLAVLLEADLQMTRPGDINDFFAREQIELYGVDTFWDLPHDPRTPYYRASEARIGEKSNLFHFVVPMFPERWLKTPAIANYMIENADRIRPTAVALSVLDVKGPADWEGHKEIVEHWTYTHFLVDGHHKVAAAVRAGRPARVLSFTAIKAGISTLEQIYQAVDAFVRTAH